METTTALFHHDFLSYSLPEDIVSDRGTHVKGVEVLLQATGDEHQPVFWLPLSTICRLTAGEDLK